jgi:3-hydroxyisobutyrate dehydrogenase
MKLINNFVCGVQAASFAEAMAMVEAGGLDRDKALSILNGGASGSGILKPIPEHITANDFTPNFNLRWMAKDLSYALDNAFDKGIALETAGAALRVFKHALSQGHGDEDFSAVVKTAAISTKT